MKDHQEKYDVNEHYVSKLVSHMFVLRIENRLQDGGSKT